eukprot:11812609-Karenia_brevis.AAC.1
MASGRSMRPKQAKHHQYSLMQTPTSMSRMHSLKVLGSQQAMHHQQYLMRSATSKNTKHWVQISFSAAISACGALRMR